MECSADTLMVDAHLRPVDSAPYEFRRAIGSRLGQPVLSHDDGSHHAGPVGQSVYAAIVGELTRLLEGVTEPIPFTQTVI